MKNECTDVVHFVPPGFVDYPVPASGKRVMVTRIALGVSFFLALVAYYPAPGWSDCHWLTFCKFCKQHLFLGQGIDPVK